MKYFWVMQDCSYTQDAPASQANIYNEIKSKRNKTYEEYLVKWKGRLVEDSSWLAREEVDHLGFI